MKMLPSTPSLRKSYTICFFVAFFILLLNAYLNIKLYTPPCFLNYLERMVLFAVTLSFFASALYHHTTLSKNIFGIINMILNLLGLLTVGRHIWLQHYSPTAITVWPHENTSTGLIYLKQWLIAAYQGKYICYQTLPTFIGIPTTSWLFYLFLIFFIISIGQTFRSLKKFEPRRLKIERDTDFHI